MSRVDTCLFRVTMNCRVDIYISWNVTNKAVCELLEFILLVELPLAPNPASLNVVVSSPGPKDQGVLMPYRGFRRPSLNNLFKRLLLMNH